MRCPPLTLEEANCVIAELECRNALSLDEAARNRRRAAGWVTENYYAAKLTRAHEEIDTLKSKLSEAVASRRRLAPGFFGRLGHRIDRILKWR